MQYVMSIERIAEERGIEQGITRERSLILRQLGRKLGALSDEIRDRIQGLSLGQLEDLGEALLDFTAPVNLVDWLDRLQQLKADVIQTVTEKFESLEETASDRVAKLPLEQLSVLRESVAQWNTVDELLAWLENQAQIDSAAHGSQANGS
ncbi:MAG: DUF4351 domain-containing protein [Microcoleus sp. SM1_3_4]|nr:DUF4351 domain-containing protein [Microcoleus sp. SM1_3_4]